jgi:hypothetical protein
LPRTDHQSLTWVHTQAAPTGMIARWLEVVASFNFRVIHRAGTNHGNAGAPGNRIPGSAATKRLPLPAKSEMLMARKNDNVLWQVRGWVKTLKPPDQLVRPSLSPETQLYTDVFDDLFLDSDNILCRVTDPAAHSIPISHRICIPSDIQAMIIEATHVTGGHMAAQKTLVRVNRTCYFRGISKR